MRARLSFLVLCALVTLSSCPAPNDPNGVDAATFINKMFQASAQCSPTFLAQAEPIFLDTQVRAQIQVAVATFNRDLADPLVEFSRAAYDECIKAADNGACDAINATSGACASVFRGKLNPGGVCAEGVECATGSSCFQDRGACGDCRVIAVEGRDCTAANCEDGTFCNATQVCEAKPQAEKFHEGDTCSLATGCGGGVLSGLACAPDTCKPIHVVDVGAPCGISPASTEYCKDSSSVHSCIDDGTGATVCTKRPGLGSPCNSDGACDATVAACVGGQCVDQGVAGDACDDGRGCKLGFACKAPSAGAATVCTALTTASVPPKCN